MRETDQIDAVDPECPAETSLSNWPEWVLRDEHILSDGHNLKMVYATYEALLAKNGDPLIAAILTASWTIHRAAINEERF